MQSQNTAQLERRIADLERLSKQLLAPKSKARIIAGTGGSGGDAGRFILTSTPSGGATGSTGAAMTATANIVQANSPATSVAAGVTLYLNYDMYSDLVSGDYGDAVKDARGVWMAVNAPCSSGGS